MMPSARCWRNVLTDAGCYPRFLLYRDHQSFLLCGHNLLNALNDEKIRQTGQLRLSDVCEIAPVIKPTIPERFDRIIRAAFDGT